MAWCANCARYIDDNLITPLGGCPRCGRDIVSSEETEKIANDGSAEGKKGIPWHFKTAIVLTIAYLGYRLYQGIEWILHHV